MSWDVSGLIQRHPVLDVESSGIGKLCNLNVLIYISCIYLVLFWFNSVFIALVDMFSEISIKITFYCVSHLI